MFRKKRSNLIPAHAGNSGADPSQRRDMLTVVSPGVRCSLGNSAEGVPFAVNGDVLALLQLGGGSGDSLSDVLHRPGVSEAETVISDTEGTFLRLRSRPPSGR